MDAAGTNAAKAQKEWAAWRWEDRAAVLLRAADLLATKYRATINAATMLGQSKTIFQSEIDAACEMIDFWRFNVQFAGEIMADQPVNSPGMLNSTDYRGLEGFVYAVTPFNFTAIAGNVPTAPVLMGGVALWKPASTAMLSAHYILRLLTEAGLPPGAANVLFGAPAEISEALIRAPEIRKVTFTGSTAVGQSAQEWTLPMSDTPMI